MQLNHDVLFWSMPPQSSDIISHDISCVCPVYVIICWKNNPFNRKQNTTNRESYQQRRVQFTCTYRPLWSWTYHKNLWPIRFSFHQSVYSVGFCQMPGGERNIVNCKLWHPTWNLRLCARPAEGTGIHPLWINPPRWSPEHVRASAHPSLLICRSPAGLLFTPPCDSSLSVFLYVCYLHDAPGIRGLQGKARASHLFCFFSSAWISHRLVSATTSKTDNTANGSPLTVETAVIKGSHSHGSHKLTLRSSLTGICPRSMGGR